MIDLIAAAGIGGLIGFGTCAVLTMGKVADDRFALWEPEQDRDWKQDDGSAEEDAWAAGYDAGYKLGLRDDAHEMRAAHTRCSDALETARNRIERALEQITPGANATVSRIGRILRGEQG